MYYIAAGDHRGPGGVGDQRRHLPGTRVNVPAGLWWCTWAHLSRSWWPPKPIYIYIHTSNLIARDGIQFPTDHSNDPFLV